MAVARRNQFDCQLHQESKAKSSCCWRYWSPELEGPRYLDQISLSMVTSERDVQLTIEQIGRRGGGRHTEHNVLEGLVPLCEYWYSRVNR